MTTYRFAFRAFALQGLTKDDVLAVALSAADALTITDGAGFDGQGNVWVRFRALNAQEAQATAKAVLKASRRSASIDSGHLQQVQPKSVWATRVHA